MSPDSHMKSVNPLKVISTNFQNLQNHKKLVELIKISTNILFNNFFYCLPILTNLTGKWSYVPYYLTWLIPAMQMDLCLGCCELCLVSYGKLLFIAN